MKKTPLDNTKSEIVEMLDSIERAIHADEFDDQQLQIQLSQIEDKFNKGQQKTGAGGTAPLNNELNTLSEQKKDLKKKVQKANEIGIKGLQVEIKNLKAELEKLGKPKDLQNLYDTLQTIISEIDTVVFAAQSIQQNIELSQEKVQSLQDQTEGILNEQKRLSSVLAEFEQKNDVQQQRTLCMQKAKQAQSIESALRQHISTTKR